MAKVKVSLVIAELNVFVDTEDETLDPTEAMNVATEYVRAHYPGENWEYLGTEGFDYRARCLFQRIDLKVDDVNHWVVGDVLSAPWWREETAS